MRGALLTIALFLLAGAALLTLWPGGWGAGSAGAPAGQYPIGWDRPEWSVKEQTKSYGPAPGMGSNVVRSTGEEAAAPKVRCAMSDTCPSGLGLAVRYY